MQDSDSGKWLLLAAIGIVAALLIFAMHDEARIKDGSSLPKGATDIVEVGPGWFEFTYKSKRFLYHQTGIGDNRIESLATLGDK